MIHFESWDDYIKEEKLEKKEDIGKIAVEFLLRIKPAHMRHNGQEIIIITEVAYQKLLDILGGYFKHETK